jgi:hypothetical protein
MEFQFTVVDRKVINPSNQEIVTNMTRREKIGPRYIVRFVDNYDENFFTISLFILERMNASNTNLLFGLA